MAEIGKAERAGLDQAAAAADILRKKKVEDDASRTAGAVGQPQKTPAVPGNKDAFTGDGAASALDGAEKKGKASPMIGPETKAALGELGGVFSKLFKPVDQQITPPRKEEAPKEKPLVTKESEMFKPAVKASGDADKVQDDIRKRAEAPVANADAIAKAKDDLNKKQTEAQPTNIV